MSTNYYDCEVCDKEVPEFDTFQGDFGIEVMCDDCFWRLSRKWKFSINQLYLDIGYAKSGVSKKAKAFREKHWEHGCDEYNQPYGWYDKNKSIEPRLAIKLLEDVIESRTKKDIKENAKFRIVAINRMLDNKHLHINA